MLKHFIMDIPNAKICPRCGKVVPLHLGVCDHCARLFRTPFEGTVTENRTMMFYHLPFPIPVPATPPPRPRFSALRWAADAGRILGRLRHIVPPLSGRILFLTRPHRQK